MRTKHILKNIRANFECQRCNLCCKAPGFVFVTGRDLGAMAAHLKMSEERFFDEYCEKEGDHTVLKTREDKSCIFLDESGCKIHEVKPKQCRQFPFKWRDYDAFDYCEGILKIKNEHKLKVKS